MALLPKLTRDFTRYFLISAVALAVDFAIFLGLESLGARPAIAATVGWTAGLVTHYELARRFLFTAMPRGGTLAQRARRLFVYATPSFAGLALTIVVVEVGIALGASPALSKAIAAGGSFLLAFVARRLMYGEKPQPIP